MRDYDRMVDLFETDLEEAEAEYDNDFIDPLEEQMVRYDDSLSGDEQVDICISEIVVPSEFDKQQLLTAFEYIHNLRDINSDFRAVHTIMHLYHCADAITVQPVSGNKYTKIEFVLESDECAVLLDVLEHAAVNIENPAVKKLLEFTALKFKKGIKNNG